MRKQDAGQYECTAENGAGSSLSKRVFVSVTGNCPQFEFPTISSSFASSLLDTMRRFESGLLLLLGVTKESNVRSSDHEVSSIDTSGFGSCPASIF